ncbi:MAG: SpoIID/LytB domain-containing protein [Nitrospira sp. SB0666_bin_27]|nr:SpoIID/LytB domain-containing protein [Nitrospira sp. SB0666_bin_27]MYF25528.1 SpoIID/LytB domain-containing protein [Nitrospira sp. SB0678_bin_10]
MLASSPARVLLLFIGLVPLPWVHASDQVRVALAEQADRVTVASAGELRLETSSGDHIDVLSEATVVLKGHELQVDGNMVRGNGLAIHGTHNELQVTIRGSSPDAVGQHWSVYGALEITARDEHLLIVNVVDLEEYVAGVVSSEVNPEWHEELLRTQAVAARTYVLHKKLENAAQPFDVYASVQDQVYTGRKNVNEAVLDAVRRTRGQVLTYEGRPIFAVYSSTTAGPTEDAMNVWAKDLPYLKGVACPFDQKSPWYEWRATIPFDTVEARLKEEGYPIGWLATLTPYGMTTAGRVKGIRILHSRGELVITGQEFRRILGYSKVRSTRFSIERIDRHVVFAGKGAGHGVGLCQWGAKEMAELGYPYQSILRYYYPGTEILPRDQVVMTLPSS